MSSCEHSTTENSEGESLEASDRLASGSPCPTGDSQGPDSGGGGSAGGSGGPTWSAEFKKRRHAFENAVENEDGGMFEFADQATRSSK